MKVWKFINVSSIAVAAACLQAVAAAQVCPGGTVPVTLPTQSASFGFFSGAWNSADPGIDPLELPRFDPSNFPGLPAGATLVRAEFLARVVTQSEGSITLGGDSACSVTWAGNVDAQIASPGLAPLEPYLSCSKFIQRQIGPVGMTVGQTLPIPFQQQVGNCPSGNVGGEQPVIITDPGQLALFTGAGNISFEHNGTTSNLASGVGCGNIIVAAEFRARVEVFISYTYCLDIPNGDPQCPCVGPSPHYRRPGSLLLFPEFDNRPGSFTLATVTNTKCDDADGDVRVEFRFYDEQQCLKQDASRNLTACDTFSFIASALNPQPRRGFFYVFAKDARDNPIVWNHLIGNVLILSALDEFDYSMNAVAFRGVGSHTGIEQIDGTPTDLNGNGHLDLDGREYEPAPDSITIPRFFGQDQPNTRGGPPVPSLFRSQLILVALTGGRQFDTTVDFCIFNDNEEAFSSEWTFRCWDKPYLTDITGLFLNDFLKTTDHAHDEIFGASDRESGWMIVHGAVANSTSTTIEKPSIYATLVERVGHFAASDLPWECGIRINGRLYPASVDGE